VIHNLLVGLAGEKPLLTLWREIVYEDRYLDWYDYGKIKSQFDFFRQWQEAILLLQVEYYHAMESEPGQNTAIIWTVSTISTNNWKSRNRSFALRSRSILWSTQSGIGCSTPRTLNLASPKAPSNWLVKQETR
jgi:hypothetical protein